MSGWSFERFQKSAFYRAATARYPLLRKLPAWGWVLVGLAGLGMFGLALFTTPSTAAADPTLPGSGTLSSLQLVTQVTLKLAVVIGLIYVSLYMLRRWKGNLPGGSQRRLTVVETLRLSPRQTLHLVQVDNQVLLIGATDQGLNLLTEVDPTLPSKDEDEAQDPIPAVLAADFRTTFDRVRRVS